MRVSFCSRRIWVAKVIKNMTENTIAAMPTLYMTLMSRYKIAKTDTSINARMKAS